MAFLYRINRVKGKIVKNFLIISVISGIFIFNINSKSQSTTYQKKQIVKIYYNSPKELDELRKLDLDIIEGRDNYVITIIEEKDNIENFTYKILIPDTFKYFNSPYSKKLQEGYHTLDTMYEDMDELASSDIASVISFGTSVEGREIKGLRISADPSSYDSSKPDIFYVCLQHAREWASMEVCVKLADYLISKYSEDSTIKTLIDSKEIWIIPVANPDGLAYTVSSDRLWRKNRKDNLDGTYGVDLNRNYDLEFGSNASSDSSGATYSGESAFSEPETAALRDLFESTEPSGLIDFHSYYQAILYPWAYTTTDSDHHAVLNTIATEFTTLVENVNGLIFSSGKPSDVIIGLENGVGGSLMDYVFSEYNCPAFAIELRPDTLEEGGFELPASEIDDAFLDVRDTAIALARISKQNFFSDPTYPSDVMSLTSGGCGISSQQ